MVTTSVSAARTESSRAMPQPRRGLVLHWATRSDVAAPKHLRRSAEDQTEFFEPRAEALQEPLLEAVEGGSSLVHERTVLLLRSFADSLEPSGDDETAFAHDVLDVMDECEEILGMAAGLVHGDAYFDLLTVLQFAVAQRLSDQERWHSDEFGEVRRAVLSLAQVSPIVDEDSMRLLDALAQARLYALDPTGN